MLGRGNRPFGAVIAALSLLVLSAIGPARATLPRSDDAASLEPLEWELLEAETAIAQGESRIAASHYRGALRETWYLLGLLSLAEGELEPARDALELARNAAAIELERPRVALALVALRLGGFEEPLRELRFAALEDRLDRELQRLFARVLAALGRSDELEAHLEALRGLDETFALELEAELAEQPAPPLPTPELGSLARATPAERSALRARLAATLERIYHNLAVLHRRTQFGDGAFHHRMAEQVASRYPERSEPLGKLELEQSSAVGDVSHVAPPGLELVELMERLPPALHPALVAMDHGDFATAEQRLHEHLAGPEAAEARALLGRMLAHRGEHERARQELRAAVETPPGSGEAHQDLARLAWRQGDRGEALAHLRHAAERGSLDRDLALLLADAELAAGNLAAAETQLRYLEKEFGSVEASLRMARLGAAGEARTVAAPTPSARPVNTVRASMRRPTTSREKADLVKRALEAATRAVQNAPSSEEVLLVHTRMALAVGVEASAERTVEPLVRMRPDVAEYQVLLGEVWRYRRRMSEAAEAFARALEIDPDHAPAFLPLALALNHESRFDEAKPWFERHLALEPGELEALAGLAEAEERLGDDAAAERLAAEVLARDGLHARAQLVMGMIRLGSGELGEARRALERAVARDPMLAKAHYQLSLTCMRLRDRDCALRHQELYERARQGPEASYIQLEAAAPETMTRQTDQDDPPR